MNTVLVVLLTALVVGCSYSGSEMWRRSACNGIVDVDERAQCIEEATRPQKEYEQDVEAAKQRP